VRTKVILISGHARNGKDTLAEAIKNEYESLDASVMVIHFADLLKFICRTYFGWSGEKNSEGRRILQYVGTDLVRTRKPGYWVDFVGDFLELFGEYWDYVIIPDCRFPNEVIRLAKRGFDTVHVRVIRDNFDNRLTEEQKNHPSETALDNFPADIYIHNNGTLDDLYKKVNRLIMEKKL
jgi:hypothetical protein